MTEIYIITLTITLTVPMHYRTLMQNYFDHIVNEHISLDTCLNSCHM